MRIVPELDHKIRREIRDARAIDPLISVVALQEQLEKQFARTFSRKYIAKLAMKVERQGLIEADRTKLEERMQFTRENYRMMREALLKVVYWKEEDGPPRPLMRDKVEAAKNVVMLDLAILNAEAAAGMYKKPIEAIAKEFRYDPLSDEIRTIVIAAWTRGGLLPRAAIEQMIPQVTSSSFPPNSPSSASVTAQQNA
jgi:hypothetical protein